MRVAGSTLSPEAAGGPVIVDRVCGPSCRERGSGAVLPLRTVLGEPEECPRQVPGVTPEVGRLGSYVAGRRFDEVMLETYAKSYPR